MRGTTTRPTSRMGPGHAAARTHYVLRGNYERWGSCPALNFGAGEKMNPDRQKLLGEGKLPRPSLRVGRAPHWGCFNTIRAVLLYCAGHPHLFEGGIIPSHAIRKLTDGQLLAHTLIWYGFLGLGNDTLPIQYTWTELVPAHVFKSCFSTVRFEQV